MKYFEMGLIKNYIYSILNRFYYEYNYVLILFLFNLYNYFYMMYWFVILYNSNGFY